MEKVSHKIIGDRQNLAKKECFISGMKVSPSESGELRISGYANTKNNKDRYGDIPTVYKAKRNFVYDLSSYKDNAVLLRDHKNDTEFLAGKMLEIHEDETGLYFEAKLLNSPLPGMVHTREAVKEGMLKGISIAGIFHYENPENPSQLIGQYVLRIGDYAVISVNRQPDAPGVKPRKIGECRC